MLKNLKPSCLSSVSKTRQNTQEIGTTSADFQNSCQSQNQKKVEVNLHRHLIPHCRINWQHQATRDVLTHLTVCKNRDEEGHHPPIMVRLIQKLRSDDGLFCLNWLAQKSKYAVRSSTVLLILKSIVSDVLKQQTH